MKSSGVPRKGISGATGTVNGGLFQAMLWDVLEEKAGRCSVSKKFKTFAIKG